MKGFKKADVLVKKEQLENNLLEFIKTNNLSDKYGRVIPELDSIYLEKQKHFEYDYLIASMPYTSDYLAMANRIVKWVTEQEKADSDRKKGYQNRDKNSQIRRLKGYQPNLLPVYENEILYFLVTEALKYADQNHFMAIDHIFSGLDSSTIKTKIDQMVSTTALGDIDQRLAMFEMSLADLEKQKDPFIELALMMKEEFDANELSEEKYEGALSKLTPQLINAYMDFEPGNIHPDANGTKRFNFGQVGGYSPEDGVLYKYYTTFSGMIAKETGEDNFIVPDKVKEEYNTKDYGIYFDPKLGDIPVNILVNNNGTNGSSGSSLLNGKGELVGLDFDTNFDGVIADYWYDPSFCRSITVSSRYMLFLMDEVYHLDELLEELTIH